MSIVIRKFAASPKRGAAETWIAIIDVIARNDVKLKTDLGVVTGVAASIIAEQTPASFPITIVGSGPRLRIYCLYDDNAIAEEAHEEPLSWNIFESNWKVHFPVEESDLDWVSKILQEKGDHFVAYQSGETIKGEEGSSSPVPQLTINTERLKKNV